MKQRILILSLAALWAWAPMVSGSVKHVEKGATDLGAEGIKTIVVNNARGSVVVRPGHGRGIHMSAIKTLRAATESQARDMAEETRVETDTENGRLLIEVVYPKRHSVHISLWDFTSARWPQAIVDLTLEIPAGLTVELNSASGDLATTDLKGDQVLETVSGDIEVHNAHRGVKASTTSGDLWAFAIGASRLRTVSGDLKVEGASGALTINTTSGDISVSEATDSISVITVSGTTHIADAPRGLKARSTSGDVIAGKLAGGVALRTVSGDVRVVLDHPLQRADIMSSSGDLVVHLARNVGCTLDMKTSSGSLDVFVPLDSEHMSRRSITGVVRGGRAPVYLRTSSGNIDVRNGG